MTEAEDYLAMRLLDLIAEAAKDCGWLGAWQMLLAGDLDGALALAEWVERQSLERRAELCKVLTGVELHPATA